ncbi:hypothetical protein M5V91_15265 [Cytobacillus pseudoceanisediminis]|uniref:hypothetical protein n=1 Tax=Cytobacillus pseudoceanisediminis TaxID=3051614 RepID=UPI00218486EC|nr:hypothetical protein [Cytobacillus pseudoceanisediminis]UQX52402.1 hypothetical protein M5V91_15265 [Cytobacillus pseudoceanisediminis]
MLQNDLAKKKKNIIKKIETYYDERIERALNRGKDPEKRRQYVSDALDKKAARLEELKKSFRTAVPKYMKQFPKKALSVIIKTCLKTPTVFQDCQAGNCL